MAQVTLPPYIAAISGRVGNLVYRSRKQPDGTYKTYVHEYRATPKRPKNRTDIDSTSDQHRTDFEG